MSSLAVTVGFVLVSSLILLAVLVYLLLSKMIHVLDAHLERLQSKLDVMQVQLSEQTVLLEMLIRKLS